MASVTITEMITYIYMGAIGIPSAALYGFIMMMYIVFVYHKLPGLVNILLMVILTLPFLYDAIIKGAYYSLIIIIGVAIVLGIGSIVRNGL